MRSRSRSAPLVSGSAFGTSCYITSSSSSARSRVHGRERKNLKCEIDLCYAPNRCEFFAQKRQLGAERLQIGHPSRQKRRRRTAGGPPVVYNPGCAETLRLLILVALVVLIARRICENRLAVIIHSDDRNDGTT